MPENDYEAHIIKLVDIPMVRRLIEEGTLLDSEAVYTAAETPRNALFSSLFLPQRGIHTVVARIGRRSVVGLFRLQPEQAHARIISLAPELQPGMDDSGWLLLLDAMTAEAGRRNAHMLIAEVDESASLFQTMRTAGFAVYARQEIWVRPPKPLPPLHRAVQLTPEVNADAHGIRLLYSDIVPRLVQQIALPPGHSQGFVYRQDKRIEGYIAISEGKTGIYMMPYLHPDIYSHAPALLHAAMHEANRPDRLPVYVCVRRYQDWLEDALYEMGFVRQSRQAVMVRHIAAGVRSAEFMSLAKQLETLPSAVKPPPVIESLCEYQQE
jgi:hypothetical protein